MALHSSKTKSSNLGSKFNNDRSRDDSPSSTQIIMEHDAPTTTQKGSLRTRKKSNGDESKLSRKVGNRRDARDSSSEGSQSSESSASDTSERPYRRKYSSRASTKSHKVRELATTKSRSTRDRSPRNKETPEKIPYFIDAMREEDRIRTIYGESSRSRNRSSSRSRRRSRTRNYSRDRRRYSHRSADPDRRRSPSYDRHRSWRNSRSPSRRHDQHHPPMLIHGGPPFFPIVPLPFQPQFAPAHFPPRFPHGMLRPPFPTVVCYLPQQMFRPRGGYMPRPGRPWRNNNYN